VRRESEGEEEGARGIRKRRRKGGEEKGMYGPAIGVGNSVNKGKEWVQKWPILPNVINGWPLTDGP